MTIKITLVTATFFSSASEIREEDLF